MNLYVQGKRLSTENNTINYALEFWLGKSHSAQWVNCWQKHNFDFLVLFSLLNWKILRITRKWLKFWTIFKTKKLNWCNKFVIENQNHIEKLIFSLSITQIWGGLFHLTQANYYRRNFSFIFHCQIQPKPSKINWVWTDLLIKRCSVHKGLWSSSLRTKIQLFNDILYERCSKETEICLENWEWWYFLNNSFQYLMIWYRIRMHFIILYAFFAN